MKKRRILMYNVIAFYDLYTDHIRWEKLYEFALAFMEQHGQKPTRMSLEGDGIKESLKTKSFRHYNKLIREKNFQGLRSFWIGAGYDENGGGDMDDCYIGFAVGKDSLNSKGHIFLYYRDPLVPWCQADVRRLAQVMAQDGASAYGTAFQLDQGRKDPLRYIYAIVSYGDDEDLEKQIRNWDHGYSDPWGECGTYKTGDLRDVYLLNFIGDAHFKRDVFGQSLREWIESDPAHGTLEPLTDSLWTWQVPEENIPRIREYLKPTDILVCFRPYD